jgi:hypothetical protein
MDETVFENHSSLSIGLQQIRTGAVTIKQLQEACERGEARLILDYPRFRLSIYLSIYRILLGLRSALYMRGLGPSGLTGWALYRRGWRIKHN